MANLQHIHQLSNKELVDINLQLINQEVEHPIKVELIKAVLLELEIQPA